MIVGGEFRLLCRSAKVRFFAHNVATILDEAEQGYKRGRSAYHARGPLGAEATEKYPYLGILASQSAHIAIFGKYNLHLALNYKNPLNHENKISILDTGHGVCRYSIRSKRLQEFCRFAPECQSILRYVWRHI